MLAQPFNQLAVSTIHRREPLIKLSSRALVHNAYIVKKVAKQSKLLAMIKSDGYGHGLSFVAQTLNQHVDGFGVACFSELAQLRTVSQKLAVLIQGVYNEDEWRMIAKLNTQVVIHHQEQLAFAQKIVQPNVMIWLKVNTGMNRLGFSPKEAIQVAKKLHHLGYSFLLCSHFANSDEPEHIYNLQQERVFFETKQQIEDEIRMTIPFSFANSAAILSRPETHGAWVRAGIMLYGANPFVSGDAKQYDLRPVMQVTTTVIACHSLTENQAIGYGSTYVTKAPMQLGIIAFGYGDGYPRSVESGVVWVDGVLCPIVGRVSMDMMAIDLSQHPTPKIGLTVELWGENLTVDSVAKSVGTISYELLCQLTTRPKRVFQ